MAIELTHPETARRYECTFVTDQRILVPGIYKGYISAAPPEAAEAMIQQGHPAFVRKEGVSEEPIPSTTRTATSSLSMCDKE